LTRVLVGLFGIVLVLAAIAFVPLRLALDAVEAEDAGLTATGVSGTVWSGRIDGAALHGVTLGDVDARLLPGALVMGAVKIAAIADGGDLSGQAVFVRRGDLTGLEDVDAIAPLSLFRTALPLTGALRLEGVSVHFREGRCVLAEGRVATDALQRNAGLLGGPGPLLSGTARCDGAAVAFPLQGQGAQGAVSLTIAVSPDGRYRTVARIEPADPAVGAALGLAGFAAAGSGFERSEEGRWRR
jgi:general secretion pathway protein N